MAYQDAIGTPGQIIRGTIDGYESGTHLPELLTVFVTAPHAMSGRYMIKPISGSVICDGEVVTEKYEITRFIDSHHYVNVKITYPATPDDEVTEAEFSVALEP